MGAAVAYVLWFRGIKVLSPNEVTFLGLLSPLVAALLGWIVLGESLTPAQLLGAALALGAVVLAARSGPRPPAAEAPAPPRVLADR
ncbi:EamA family transporter [Kitasatospora sp. NPDC004289]